MKFVKTDSVLWKNLLDFTFAPNDIIVELVNQAGNMALISVFKVFLREENYEKKTFF